MTGMFKRELAVEKSKLAVGKREKAVEKGLANLKEKEERMTKEKASFGISQKQTKLDSDSMFEGEIKLWHDKRDLSKDQRHFDERMRQERMDLQKKQETLNEKMRKDKEK